MNNNNNEGKKFSLKDRKPVSEKSGVNKSNDNSNSDNKFSEKRVERSTPKPNFSEKDNTRNRTSNNYEGKDRADRRWGKGEFGDSNTNRRTEGNERPKNTRDSIRPIDSNFSSRNRDNSRSNDNKPTRENSRFSDRSSSRDQGGAPFKRFESSDNPRERRSNDRGPVNRDFSNSRGGSSPRREESTNNRFNSRSTNSRNNSSGPNERSNRFGDKPVRGGSERGSNPRSENFKSNSPDRRDFQNKDSQFKPNDRPNRFSRDGDRSRNDRSGFDRSSAKPMNDRFSRDRDNSGRSNGVRDNFDKSRNDRSGYNRTSEDRNKPERNGGFNSEKSTRRDYNSPRPNDRNSSYNDKPRSFDRNNERTDKNSFPSREERKSRFEIKTSPEAENINKSPGKRIKRERIENPETKSKFGYKGGNKEYRKAGASLEKGTSLLNGEVRLNRYISNSGLCSRREADGMISQGLVKVNGAIVTELGTKVFATDDVRVDGQRIMPEKPVYIILNKPKGYITTTDDPEDRKTVMDLIDLPGKERIYPIGRLDRNTTGVLLLTNDGELSQKLTHPSFEIKKIYRAKLSRKPSKEHMLQWVEGVDLEDGMMSFEQIGFVDENDPSILGLEIHSGRNRIVRRMFEHFGYEVEALDRVLMGEFDKLKLGRGKWRFLSEKEIGYVERLKRLKPKANDAPKVIKREIKDLDWE